jgi:hypothetical protein
VPGKVLDTLIVLLLTSSIGMCVSHGSVPAGNLVGYASSSRSFLALNQSRISTCRASAFASRSEIVWLLTISGISCCPRGGFVLAKQAV